MNYRNARVQIRLLQSYDLGSDPGIDGNGKRNYCIAAISLG
jgi:hypothetical protein